MALSLTEETFLEYNVFDRMKYGSKISGEFVRKTTKTSVRYFWMELINQGKRQNIRVRKSGRLGICAEGGR